MTIQHDPQEDDPKLKKIINQAEKEAEENLVKRGFVLENRGYCYDLWIEMKRILKEKYHIEWKSIGELNPQVLLD